MYSADFYPVSNRQDGTDFMVTWLWTYMARKFELQAILLLEVSIEPPSFRVVSSYNLPIEPFNGAEKTTLSQMVDDCFVKYAKAHAHNISHLPFAKAVTRYSQKVTSVNRVLFVPWNAYGVNFIFFGLLNNDSKSKEVSNDLSGFLDMLVSIITVEKGYKVQLERLSIMEKFVKEVGHDIASCVQATLPKIRNIVEKRVPASSVSKKLYEIENEVMSAYVISESLGIAVDPNYKLDNPDEYDLVNVVANVVQHYSAEAEEKRLQIRVSNGNRPYPMWGDPKAIQQCVGHIVLNAIKYAHSGTVVEVELSDDKDYSILTISDKGFYLPAGEDLKRIWDFGFRGKKAMELHVNGSGIGLYTVKKIALAHGGMVTADGIKDVIIFRLHLPKKLLLRKKLGFLL